MAAVVVGAAAAVEERLIAVVQPQHGVVVQGLVAVPPPESRGLLSQKRRNGNVRRPNERASATLRIMFFSRPRHHLPLRNSARESGCGQQTATRVNTLSVPQQRFAHRRRVECIEEVSSCETRLGLAVLLSRAEGLLGLTLLPSLCLNNDVGLYTLPAGVWFYGFVFLPLQRSNESLFNILSPFSLTLSPTFSQHHIPLSFLVVPF